MNGVKGKEWDSWIFLFLFLGVATASFTMGAACVLAVVQHKWAVALILLFGTYACVNTAYTHLQRVKF